MHDENIVDGHNTHPGVCVGYKKAGIFTNIAQFRLAAHLLVAGEPGTGDFLVHRHFVVDQKPKIFVRGVGVGILHLNMGVVYLNLPQDGVVRASGFDAIYSPAFILSNYGPGLLSFVMNRRARSQLIEITLGPGDARIESVGFSVDRDCEASPASHLHCKWNRRRFDG